jgi:hypothetical protein
MKLPQPMISPRNDPAGVPFHRRYLKLVEEIERSFRVARWSSGDVEIWPLARMDLYLDMYWHNVGGAVAPLRSMPLRALARLATPLTNAWKSRGDLAHWVARPAPAHAAFLGDGVSLDCVDGAWQDRYGEPVIAALERRGLTTFLMQSAELGSLPWQRPTFAANVVAARGSLARFAAARPCELPDHDDVVRFLARNGVHASCLDRSRLARRASAVSATASAFERVLRIVRPKVAFVVTYYAGLGPAFVLACRRQGIFSIDLQHCPQEGAHKAYGWSALPENGYRILPALFWNWTERDAAFIRNWADRLALPWHRSLYGGHAQLGSFLDDGDPATEGWDRKFAAMTQGAAEREILVALQPVGGFRAQWDALVSQIRAAPPTWRWWIRRHPSARSYQDAEYRSLVSLRMSNVFVDEALSLPLPALLRHMSVVVSRFSGASAEAAAFGVPAFFLSEEARGQFSALIERGTASVIDIGALITNIARLPAVTVRPASIRQPGLDETLLRVDELAQDYSRLFKLPIVRKH